MNKTPEQIANLRKWADVLESDAYKQTTQYLHNEDGFCCLGVACDIFKDQVMAEWKDNHFLGFDDVLPPTIRELLGINKNGAFYISEEDECTLSGMNDEGSTFAEIAKIIRENKAFLGGK